MVAPLPAVAVAAPRGVNDRPRRTSVIALAVTLVLGGCFPVASAHAQAAGREHGATTEALSTPSLVQVGRLSGLSLSPDRKHVVVRLDRDNVKRNETDLTWYRVSLKDGRSNAVCDAGQPLWDINGYLDTSVAQWSADGKWIYVRRLERQQVQVWRCSSDGIRREQITHADADVRDFILEGNRTLHVALEGATRDEILEAEGREYDAGVLMDQTTIPGFPIVRSFPHNGRMVSYRTLGPKGAKWGRTPLLGDQPLRFVSMDVQDRAMRPASAEVEKRFEREWSRTGHSPYDPLAREIIASADDHQTVQLISSDGTKSPDAVHPRAGALMEWTDKSTGRTAICTVHVCTDADDISAIGWAAKTNEIVFQTSAFGVAGLHVWDPQANTVATVLSDDVDIGSDRSGAVGACHLAGASSASGEVICLASGPDSPARVIAIHLASGKQRTLFDPNEDLRRGSLGVARKVEIADRWGGRAYGYLILPRSWLDLPQASRPRLPLVITSYSCPGFLTGGSGEDVPEHVLAGLGYAAICIDMSGDIARPGTGFDPRVDGNDRMLDFFEGAISELDKSGIVDPDRVVVSGFSGSASAVTYALFKSRRFTASIITTQGYLDPITCYLASAQGLCRAYNARYWPLPYDGPEGRFAETSPAAHVGKIQTPLLMQLADVEYQGMMQLHSAMLDYDRPVEMYVFPDEYHNKRQPRHRLTVYNRNVDWIEFWLRGRERADGDAKTYARWREMRGRQCQLFLEAPETGKPWYCRSSDSSPEHPAVRG